MSEYFWNVKQRKLIVALTAILTAASMSTAGAETPTREETVKILQQKYVTVLDDQHKTLLVGCSFLSISSLLAGQWIIENVFSFETTLSVVINFIGGAYFLYLLLKNKVV